ncbi:hypothetical protein [Chamaesiphon sp. VAR_48_metabat_403]|uniref:hypothetical protein n=1 Tax=Chamaesiphon sp. VAR_48_metabat_403 TaxID=2964700 RepID=UPI00286E8790|nr:hypothetical protein [Chamaesiphon sp. VAR_48_metabat_403]
MKSSLLLAAKTASSLTQNLCGLLLMLTIWQGTFLTVDTAIAAPASAINSPTNVIDRVVDRSARNSNQTDRAMKKSKDPANALLDTAETGVKINADKAERPIDDSPEIVKKTSERNSQLAGEFSKNLTKKIKNIP